MGTHTFGRAVKFPDFNLVNHHLIGFVWPIISSRTNEEYSVSLTENGFTCTCVGFNRHSKCKHITGVYDVLSSDDDDQKYQTKGL